MPFDLILQNNASKQVYLISGLTDTSDSYLVYLFENFAMPEGAQEGEYTGVLFRNGRNDVEYEFKDVILDTIAKTAEGNVEIKYLRPEVFILRYGNITGANIYWDGHKEYCYKKNQ